MNFLIRQAARSLARGAIVRPRLPALFEPAAEGPEPVPVEALATDTPRVNVEPPRTRIVEQVLRREAESVREVIERVMPRETVRETTSERVIVERQRDEHHHVREVPPPPPEREVVTHREPPQVITERTPERVIQTTVERTRELAAQPIETHTRTERIETRPAVAPIPVTIPGPVVMRPAERPPAAIAQPVDVTPTIHVTIGRVDVRAVLTSDAPAPRAASSSPPSLSLEDYLKQRGSR